MKIVAIFVTGLLLTGLAAACGGDEADLDALATSAADVEPSSTPHVVAEGLEFDIETLVVPANQEIVITLENRDRALHNVAVYTEKGGDVIYRGELFQGNDTREYRFETPDAGVYYFRCDAHPEMDGAFVVKQRTVSG